MISVATSSPSELAAAQTLCRQISRSNYENFIVASILLPREMRQHFDNVYAFCRTADDLADESQSSDIALAGLAVLRRNITNLYAGKKVSGMFMALADTVQRFQLPREPFDDLLDAFVQDQTVHRYPDLATLREYARRSANPVGRIVLTMADCRSDEHFSLSDEICTALQFTNFWQDVARDFAIGRIYLPADAMQRHGVDATLIADTLSQAHPTPLCVREAIAQQCEQTRIGLQLGRPLITMVPGWLAADIELFIEGGLATLNAIDRIDYNVLQQRPTVSKRQQAWLVMRTFFRSKILQRNAVATNVRSENKLTREASVL